MRRSSCGSSSAVRMVVFRAGIGSILSRLRWLQLSSVSKREPDEKSATLALLALGPEIAMMEGNNAFANCQSQPQSIHFACEPCIYTMKAVKDTQEMFVSNACSVILDGEFQHGKSRECWHCSDLAVSWFWRRSSDRSQRDGNLAAIRRKFHGVFQDIIQHFT